MASFKMAGMLVVWMLTIVAFSLLLTRALEVERRIDEKRLNTFFELAGYNDG